MPLNEVAYKLGDKTNYTLANLFPICDCEMDNGRENLDAWIEQAAADSGR
jgi:hypothetical protein